MKARRFNSIMPRLNAIWAGQVLGMWANSQKGPDLIDDSKIMELKFCLTGELCGAEKYTQGWTVLEYQMAYSDKHPDKNAYWGLGLYRLNRRVLSIRKDEISKLEGFVKNRELWVVSWEWMNQFLPHETRGETKISSWNNTLRYPKLRNLPGTTGTYKVRRGLIHLTQGVDLKCFSFLNEHL